MPAKYKYEEMLPAEFVAAMKDMPVVIIPTGLLEWHADHLPLGLDTLKAYGICERIVQKLDGGILMPPMYVGRPGYSSYVGTLTYSEALVNLLFTETLEQLRKVGAKVVLLLTGHYGPCQVSCIKRIAYNFNREHPDVTVIAGPEYEGVTVNGESPEDHAGKWETSMFWHLRPELTHMEKFNIVPSPMQLYPDPPHNHSHEPAYREFDEDLSVAASPELGGRAVEIIAEHLAQQIRAALQERMNQ